MMFRCYMLDAIISSPPRFHYRLFSALYAAMLMRH